MVKRFKKISNLIIGGALATSMIDVNPSNALSKVEGTIGLGITGVMANTAFNSIEKLNKERKLLKKRRYY